MAKTESPRHPFRRPPTRIFRFALLLMLLIPQACAPDRAMKAPPGTELENQEARSRPKPYPLAESSKAPPPYPILRQQVLEDLDVLLSPEEKAIVAELPEGKALARWVKDWWTRRDPTPTTGRNEAREEHYRRLETARRLFPRTELPYYDIRGRDYILLGPPDGMVRKDVQIGRFYNPRREAWVWEDLGMLAEYWDFDLDGVYTQAGPIDSPMMDGKYNIHLKHELNTLSGEWPYMTLPYGEGRVLAMKASRDEAVAEQRVNYVHDFGADPLWAVFAVNCFRGDSSRTRVELAYQIKTADLRHQAKSEGEGYEARLRQSLVFFGADDLPVDRMENEIEFESPTPSPAENTLFSGLMVRELVPDDYRLALRVEDLIGGPLQLFETEVRVPSFPADSLAVSDICFANAIKPESEPARFVKGEWNVFPHPLRRFTEDLPIQLYFEIYGLATRDGLNHYRVSYEIVPVKRERETNWLGMAKGDPFTGVSSTFSNEHEGAMVRQPLVISAAELDPDDYAIQIEVEDLIGRRKATAHGNFSVAESVIR